MDTQHTRNNRAYHYEPRCRDHLSTRTTKPTQKILTAALGPRSMTGKTAIRGKRQGQKRRPGFHHTATIESDHMTKDRGTRVISFRDNEQIRTQQKMCLKVHIRNRTELQGRVGGQAQPSTIPKKESKRKGRVGLEYQPRRSWKRLRKRIWGLQLLSQKHH